MSEINAEKVYSLGEIFTNKYFYWIGSMSTLVRWIETDKKVHNVLKATILGKDKGTRYYIKGDNIIKFISMFEDGSLHMVPRKEVVNMGDEENKDQLETGEKEEAGSDAGESTGEGEGNENQE